MACRLLRLLLCLWALVLVVPYGVEAAVVGRFVLVEGRVDLLKGGKLPLVSAKVQEGVEQGDVVRTKSGSRAQIQFVDETVLTIAPSSRVAIEDYVFDAAKGQRSATIEIFRGLVQTVVKKIYRMKEPDFVVKTHTAVLGVRGTKWYTQILPSATDVYTEEAGEVTQLKYKPSPNAGLEVKNVFPEVTGKVLLKAMQFTRVGVDLTPTVPVTITKEDLKYLQVKLIPQATDRSSTSRTPESSGTAAPRSEAAAIAVTSTPAPTVPDASDTSTTTTSTPYSKSPPTGGLATMPDASTKSTTSSTSVASPTYLPSASSLDSPVQTLSSGLYVPPPVVPPPPPSPPPQPQTFNFIQTWFGTYVFQSDYPYTSGSSVGWGWGQRTGVYDGYYHATNSQLRYVPPGGSFANTYFLPGTTTGTMSGTVTGILGQTLTGTMTFTGSLAIGGTFNYSGDVTLQPSGSMVFNYSGTRTAADGSSAGTTENGVMTFSQGTYFKQTVASASYRETSYAPYLASTVRSDAPVSGTREGYSPGPFWGSFSINSSSGLLNDYSPIETGTVDISMEGVIGEPSSDGTMTGAMTATARSSTSETDSVVGGPVTAYPNGTLVAETYGSRYLGSGNYEVEQGMWIQTSDPDATTFTARFGGSLDPFASSPPYNTGTFTGRGYGFLGEANGLGGGYFAGTISGTATGPDNSFDPPNDDSGEIRFTIAGVVRQPSPGGPWSGEVFANGRVAIDTWLYSQTTPGTVTIQPDNTATMNLNNHWRSADITSGTATSTITTTPGTFFDQVAGPGSVTYTSNPPYDQQTFQNTNGNPITNGTGTLGNFIVTNFSGTSQAGVTNVFPPSVVSPDTRLYSQGVIGPGGTGAMQLTVVDSTGWYRVRGAALKTSGANLQGMNLVGHSRQGPNRIEIRRDVQYQQQAPQ